MIQKLDETVTISPQAPVAALESESGEVKQLKKQISELTEQVAALTTQCLAPQRRNNVRCFNCDTGEKAAFYGVYGIPCIYDNTLLYGTLH